MTMIRSAVANNIEKLPDAGASIRRMLTPVILFAAVALPCLVLYHAANRFGLVPGFESSQLLNFDAGNSSSDSVDLRLERVLKEAAMEDKTVILTTLNEAWAAQGSIIDLFLESFRIGDNTSRFLNHLVIVGLDQKAHNRCLEVHRHCFALTTEGVDFSGEAYFMTPDYLQMMWRRIDFLRSVLQMGYNFIFTDADIMWFRDPFPHFYLDADFQIACDNFIGSSDNLNNKPNGGFNYVKSNNRSIKFYKYWYNARNAYPRKHDQDVLNKIKYHSFLRNIGLKMRFLDTAYFGGFCEPSKDLNLVCTMHANCCYGLDSKLHDLRLMLEDWTKFLSLPSDKKGSVQSSWSVPQNCRSSYRSNYKPKKNTEHGNKD